MVSVSAKEWEVMIEWLDIFSIKAAKLELDTETEAPFKILNIKEMFGADFVPYQIQMQAWLSILNDESLFLVSGTGSGKTEAVLAPILDILLADRRKYCLILFPQKALAQDQEFRMREKCANIGLTFQRYDSSITNQAKIKIRDNPGDILIITPDTLIGSIMKTQNEEWFDYLTKPTMIWIDEFHAMSGTLGTALCYLLRSLYLLNPTLRLYFTSATLANVSEIATLFPGHATIIKGGSQHGNIQFHIGMTKDLESLLKVLFEDTGQFLDFIENKGRIEALMAKKDLFSRKANRYHADLADNERHLILSKFREKRLQGLLCTSAISLGIDIPNVKNIVLYGFPRSFSLLLQELGRGTREYTSKGNVYLLLDKRKLIDNYYISHLDELKEAINSYRSEPVIINLLNEKILRGMVLFAIKLGFDTYEKLTQIFREAETIQKLESTLVWLFIKGLITKKGGAYKYFKDEADDYLIDFLKSLRPGFSKFQLITGKKKHFGEISVENIPYRACKGNYYLKGNQCYLITKVDVYRREVHMVRSKERYTSKNLVSSVVSMIKELKFKKFFELKVRFADFQVQVKPKKLRTYELLENNREVLVLENTPGKDRVIFTLKYETKGVLLEFASDQETPLSQMVLYQLSKIILQNATVLINISENEVDCFQNPDQRMLYFLDRSCPTGVSQQLYENIERILKKTYQIIAACPCKRGCKKCAIPVESNFLQPNFNSTDIFRKKELLALLRRCLHESGSLE